jgi:hypothetical protein
MKFFYLFGATLLSTFLNAQSNLSVFNNSGQPFYVVLNGIRQNSKPETNVQVSQIKNGSYAVKVIFADGKTPDIDKNFMIDAPYDITTRIVFKKGIGKLQLMGMEPTHGVIQEAVVYRPNDAANYSDAVVNMNMNIQETPNTTIQTTGIGTTAGVNMNVNVSETTPASVQTSNSTNTTTTTTTTTNGTIPDENVNLNMNLSVGGVNLNLNANANGSGLGTSATVTETTTSTISTSSTITTSSNTVSTNTGMNPAPNNMSNQVNANIQMNGNSQMIQNQQNSQNQTNTPLQQAANSSRVNCTKTMNRLEAFKAELQEQSFEEDRLEALQLAMKTTCLTSAQAEQLLDLFTFDENRLEVAKYLADRLTDRDNAGALAKKLTFDSNKMEYRRYISE